MIQDGSFQVQVRVASAFLNWIQETINLKPYQSGLSNSNMGCSNWSADWSISNFFNSNISFTFSKWSIFGDQSRGWTWNLFMVKYEFIWSQTIQAYRSNRTGFTRHHNFSFEKCTLGALKSVDRNGATCVQSTSNENNYWRFRRWRGKTRRWV